MTLPLREARSPIRYTRLWIGLAAVIVAVVRGARLLRGRSLPAWPRRSRSAWSRRDGKVLFTGQDIKDGQNVWQSMGGQQVGSVWGHGAYVAPDWSADWLHREAIWLLDHWAQADHGQPYAVADGRSSRRR